jgi:hypothetical protein
VTARVPTLRPALYLDPSVIEDGIRGRMRPRDRAAVCRLAAMVSEQVLSVYCPREAREAIARASPEQQKRHGREYAALKVLGETEQGWLDESEEGRPVESPEFSALVSFLKNVEDARHVMQARSTGVRDVVAAETSRLVRNAEELEARMGLRVFRPADYLSRWSTQQRLPG